MISLASTRIRRLARTPQRDASSAQFGSFGENYPQMPASRIFGIAAVAGNVRSALSATLVGAGVGLWAATLRLVRAGLGGLPGATWLMSETGFGVLAAAGTLSLFALVAVVLAGPERGGGARRPAIKAVMFGVMFGAALIGTLAAAHTLDFLQWPRAGALSLGVALLGGLQTVPLRRRLSLLLTPAVFTAAFAALNPGGPAGTTTDEILTDRWIGGTRFTIVPGGENRRYLLENGAMPRILWADSLKELHWDYTQRSAEVVLGLLPYAAPGTGPALFLGDTGWNQLPSALLNGVKQVIVTDEYPRVTKELILGEKTGFGTDLLRDRRVTVVPGPYRSFLRDTTLRFGSIHWGLSDFREKKAASGAWAKRAPTAADFSQMFRVLSTDGFINVVAWYDRSDPQEVLSILASAKAGLLSATVPHETIAKHFFVAVNEDLRASVLVSKRPLSPVLVQKIADHLLRDRLVPILSPERPNLPFGAADHRMTVDEDPRLVAAVRALRNNF